MSDRCIPISPDELGVPDAAGHAIAAPQPAKGFGDAITRGEIEVWLNEGAGDEPGGDGAQSMSALR